MTDEPDRNNIPAHIAVIMDGNGRWADKRIIAKNAGHAAGAKALRKVALEAERLGVSVLTAYAFSTENWKRSRDEVDALMDLMRDYIKQYTDEKDKNDMRLTVLGRRDRLPADLQASVDGLERETRDKTGLHMVVALDYGARDELARAARKIALDVSTGGISVNDIDEGLIAEHLDTRGLPDPELLIRTGGESRLSNFLMWQLAYSELYFTDKLWPDFKPEDLRDAIRWYQNRERRFGGR